MNLIWWGLISPDARRSEIDEVLIPRGTAEAIERGDAFAFLPNVYALPPGGKLRVINRDLASHTVGNVTVPPGATADVEAPASGQLVCTIHPAGYLDIQLKERPPLTTMILPAILLGVPMGLLAGAAVWVAQKLGTGGDADTA